MNIGIWLVAAIAGLLFLLLLVVLVGLVLGFGFNLLWWATAIGHLFRKEPPPTEADSNWSRDQSEEIK